MENNGPVRPKNCAARTNLGNINTTRPVGQAWVMLPSGPNPTLGPEALGRDWRPLAALPMPDQSGRTVLLYAYAPPPPCLITRNGKKMQIETIKNAIKNANKVPKNANKKCK